jgi:hypothetical protein
MKTLSVILIAAVVFPLGLATGVWLNYSDESRCPLDGIKADRVEVTASKGRVYAHERRMGYYAWGKEIISFAPAHKW